MNRFLSLFSLLFIFLSSCINDDEPEVTSLAPGDSCPEFTIEINDGEILSSSDLKGRESVIVFFNTGCGDCRRELPEIQKAYDEIQKRNLDIPIICISREEDKESVERFWEANSLTLPYSAQTDRRVYNLFASSVIPRIYILSPQQIITRCWSDNPLPTAEEIINSLRHDANE
ncbi:MAG: TlpA family protein disulfide reductase [Muribaculaceae bacterium]|nr:TlpA family protein disulfide reductase [Muribaculaceae bacterium]